MGVSYRVKPEPVKRAVAYICDVCGDSHGVDGDDFGGQEFLHIRRHCGYGSRWGDGTMLELDICDACQVELLGRYFDKRPEPADVAVGVEMP